MQFIRWSYRLLIKIDKARTTNLILGWYLFKENPIYGKGFFGFRLHRPDKWSELVSKGVLKDKTQFAGEYIHCDLAEIFLELGVMGASIFYAIIGFAMFKTEHTLFIPVLVAMLIASATYFPLKRPYTGMMFWLVLGMMA